MGESFEISEVDLDTPIGNFLLTAMTDYCLSSCGDGNIVKVFGIDKDSTIDVSLHINGVEVSVRKFADLMLRYGTELVKQGALSLIKEQLGEIQDQVYTLSSAIFRAAQDKFPEVQYREVAHGLAGSSTTEGRNNRLPVGGWSEPPARCTDVDHRGEAPA
jgi:hypothetical protein